MGKYLAPYENTPNGGGGTLPVGGFIRGLQIKNRALPFGIEYDFTLVQLAKQMIAQQVE